MKLMFSRVIVFLVLMVSAFSPIIAQTLTNEQLAREGARIGRAYYMATRNNDPDLQADALNQFNEILVTLRKQVQVVILTNAFNNANVPIDTPLTDARRYTRALMNAHRSGDTIAIEDAEDIAETVKRIYVAERSEKQAADYAALYEASVSCALLGLKASTIDDASQCETLKSESKAISQAFEGDSAKVVLLNNTFDYYAIRLTDAQTDAEKYAALMSQATATGEQAQVDEVARIVGMVYERYTLERSADEAKKFNETLNAILARE